MSERARLECFFPQIRFDSKAGGVILIFLLPIGVAWPSQLNGRSRLISIRNYISATLLLVMTLGLLTSCAAISPYPIPDPDRPGVHHVTVYVNDLDASERFYTSALGFEKVYAWKGGKPKIAGLKIVTRQGVFMDTGDGSMIALIAKADGDAGTPRFTIRVPDTAASYQRAIANGADKLDQGEPTTIALNGEPGISATVASVLGPDGEVIGFFQSQDLTRPEDIPIEPAEYDIQAPGRR